MSTSPEIQPDTELLVIGYGDLQHQDDSVGPRVVERIEALHLPGVRTLICGQLAAEHAPSLAHARVAVFVDAVVGAPRQVRLQPIKPGAATASAKHATELIALLALTRDAYGRAPKAWLMPIPAVRMGSGHTLSATANRGVDAGVQTLVRLAHLAL